MSNDITNLCRPLQLRPTPKCVLLALADWADQISTEGVAGPSISWLCAWTCFGRTAAIEALKLLESMGLVSVSHEVGRINHCEICLSKAQHLRREQGSTQDVGKD